jgi:hypothetical protein
MKIVLLFILMYIHNLVKKMYERKLNLSRYVTKCISCTYYLSDVTYKV